MSGSRVRRSITPVRPLTSEADNKRRGSDETSITRCSSLETPRSARKGGAESMCPGTDIDRDPSAHQRHTRILHIQQQRTAVLVSFHSFTLSIFPLGTSDHTLSISRIYLNEPRPSCNRRRLSRQINWLSRAATSLNRCCCCYYRSDSRKPIVMSGNREANCASAPVFRHTLHKVIVTDRLTHYRISNV